MSAAKKTQGHFFSIVLSIALITNMIGGSIRPATAQESSHINDEVSVQEESIPSGLPAMQQNAPRTSAASDWGITLELSVPDFTVEQSSLTDGTPCQVLRVDGYGDTDKSGSPRLPVRGAMLGIPPDSDPQVTILEAEPLLAKEIYHLCPLETPIFGEPDEEAFSGIPDYQGVEITRDEQIYSRDEFSPVDVAELVSTGFIRSQRIAQLRFSPFRYNPVSGELRYYQTIRVRVDYYPVGRSPAQPGGQKIAEGSFEDILKNILLNYGQAQTWRTRPERANTPLTKSPAQNGPAYKLLVDQDGIYELSYNYLQTAGVPVDTIDPRTFRIEVQGQEAAIYVEGESDGVFNPADYILFYGQKVDQEYTGTNMYWLTWGDGNGLRMQTADGTPGGAAEQPETFLQDSHFEQNLVYVATCFVPDDGHWFWNASLALQGVSKSRESIIQIVNLSTLPTTIAFRGNIKSCRGEPYHHTRIYLNGILVDDHTWPSLENYIFDISVPSSYLLNGANTITIENISDSTIFYSYIATNWFEVEYQSLFYAVDDALLFVGIDSNDPQRYSVHNLSSNQIDVFDLTYPLAPLRISGSQVQPEDGHFLAIFQRPAES